MKQKKIPMRMCVVTHNRVEKRNLIRIVKTEDGIVVDATGKINGHGVYLTKDIDVIKKARDKKILESIFDCEISDDIYKNAEELINSEK